jgi:hypothetical protein
LPRLFATILVITLLVATAAAFTVTENLKLEKSPITSTAVTKIFSPVCRCPSRVAHIGFRLRKTDRLDLVIVRGDTVIRTLVNGDRYRHGFHHFVWDGLDDEGHVVAEGSYEPRVHLVSEHRTILLPNPIRVDVTPPVFTLVSVRPRVFSPDGDHRRDGVAVRYRVNETAHALVLVNGTIAVRGRTGRKAASLEWYGTLQGKKLPPGTYHVAVAGRDLAGNLARPTRAVPVVLRYLTIAKQVLRVRAGTRFLVPLSTDVPRVHWLLAGRSSTAPSAKLRLRAPAPGRYSLYVTAGGHSAKAVVVVRR